MGKSGSRFTVFLFNIAVVLLSAAAVLSYFLSPLWKVKIEYNLQEETLEKMLEGSLEGQTEDIDLGEIVGGRHSPAFLFGDPNRGRVFLLHPTRSRKKPSNGPSKTTSILSSISWCRR